MTINSAQKILCRPRTGQTPSVQRLSTTFIFRVPSMDRRWRFPMIKLMRSFLCIAAIIISGVQSLSGAEITGGVKSIPAKNQVHAMGPADFNAVAGAPVKAMSPDGTLLAEGKTDGNGGFSLSIPEQRKNDTIVLSAETPGGTIRALAINGSNELNPITEILTWRILESGIPPSNFTASEWRILVGRLSEIAQSVDFSDMNTSDKLVASLLDAPEIVIALGDLSATYGMPGDNVAAVESIREAIDGFIKAMNANDESRIKSSLTGPVEMLVDGETIRNAEEFAARVNAGHKAFKDLSLKASFARIAMQGDRAELTTYERLRMSQSQGEPPSVDESWIIKYVMSNKNGTWLISKREASDCVVGDAGIATDGRIADWTGMTPCYYRRPDPVGDAGKDSITALFFARDDEFLYWRMDLEMELFTPFSDGKPVFGVPSGEFYLSFFAHESNQNCDNLINFVTNEPANAASGARVCVKDQAGNEKETIIAYQKFAVGRRSIEGSIPLKDLKFLSDGIFAFAKGRRVKMPSTRDMPFFVTSPIRLSLK